MELGRVFLSSAFRGMGDLRQAAAQAARLLGLIPVLTEDLVALSDSVRDRLRIELAQCDTYVGLFDTWRGTVPPEGTEDDRAITEEEFRIARELGLRCLAFVSRVADKDRDPLLKAFLDREVGSFTEGVWARPFDSPEQLRREIAADRGLLAEVAGKDLVHRLLADRKREALAEREGAEAAKGWHLRLAEHFEHEGRPLPNFGVGAHHRNAVGSLPSSPPSAAVAPRSGAAPRDPCGARTEAGATQPFAAASRPASCASRRASAIPLPDSCAAHDVSGAPAPDSRIAHEGT